MSPVQSRAQGVGPVAFLLVAVVAAACGPAQASASPAPAFARGAAPLLVPSSSGRLHTSASAHITFRLPAGKWRAARGESGDLLRDGTYLRSTQVNGKRCVITLTSGGRGQQHRPSLTATPKSDHIERGRTGAVRWLTAWSELPPTPPLPYAKAYSPAPRGAAWKWTSFGIGVQANAPATAACRRSLLRTDLTAVAGSVRVERGSLTAS